MDPTIKRGNIVVQKRLLADLICVVQGVDTNGIARVKLLDSPRGEEIVVKLSELIKLHEEIEARLPKATLTAISKQREIVFSKSIEKKEKLRNLKSVLTTVDPDAIAEIMAVLGKGE